MLTVKEHRELKRLHAALLGCGGPFRGALPRLQFCYL